MNFGGTFTQRLHHVFLDVRGLDHHRLKFCFGYRKMQLVTGLDVCCFLEHRHQFGQVEKFGEPRSCPVAGALRSQFNGCRGLTKSRCPCVKVSQPFLLQGVVLEITHQGVHLGHAVADGSACCKNNASPSSDLIEVAAFTKHITGLLCVTRTQTSDITHFCV